jgi:hypothetical protein
MRRLRFIFALNLFSLIAMAQDKPADPSQLPKGSVLRVVLSGPIEVENSKVGDPVRTSVLGLVENHGIKRPLLPSTLVGHITEVQVRTRAAPQSRLGIKFDKMLVASLTGETRELIVSAVIKRVVTIQTGPVVHTSTVPTSGDDPMTRAAGPKVDGLGRPVSPTHAPLSEPGPRTTSWNVEQPVKDLTLRVGDSADETIMLSKKRNIVLAPEMQMIVEVTSSAN